MTANVAITARDLFHFVSEGETLTTADGKEAWTYEIGQPVQTSPCLAAGRLIMGADDGIIYAFTSGTQP